MPHAFGSSIFSPRLDVPLGFYELVSADPSPVSLDVMKSYLRVTSSVDDALIQSMINAATEWGEKYTSRDFRIKTWNLLLDWFTDPIEIRRSPVASIMSIKYFDTDDVEQTVATTVYYLKKQTQWSQVWLKEDQFWPDDLRMQQQSITVQFKTEPYRCINEIIEAIQRTVAYWYRNRGDCSSCKSAVEAAGVTGIYDQFRIARV